VERVEGGAVAGDDVEVKDPRGNSLGRGLYSPGSAIPVRLYTRDARRTIDGALFAERILHAAERRRAFGLPSDDTNAYRLVHAEGDDLPGLIVDRLGDVFSIQIGSVGVKLREEAVLAALERFGARAIVDRSSERTAKADGFEPRTGVIRGDHSLSAFEFKER